MRDSYKKDKKHKNTKTNHKRELSYTVPDEENQIV